MDPTQSGKPARHALQSAVKTSAAPARLDELGRERGQALVRLVNSALVLAYLVFCFYPLDFAAGYPDWLIALGVFIAFALTMLVLASRAATSSVARRMIGNVIDVAGISYVMVVTDAVGVPLFILYLSATLASGFRFGPREMMFSAALSFVGFSAVVALSPVWRELPLTIPVAVALALILLPANVAHLVAQLAKATKRAEEASAAKSGFLARMSHELRTPLTGILGTTELLSNSKRLSRDDRSLLDIIRDSVKVSMRQIDNVLDFSKIEAGKLVIEEVPFDLHALLNRAVRLMRASAAEKKLRLLLRVDPAVPYRLIGDPHHLHEVLLNLLSNAVKFTEKGYVSLEAHLVAADPQSALVRFEVHDSGIGIEPSALGHIFDAFMQEDGGTTRRYGGTGLGTTIAKQLVELMGGELSAHSTKGKGSSFVATIRLARQPTEVDAARSLAGLQVLLLSDDRELARGLGTLLEGWSASLSTAVNPADATGLLARGIRLGNPVNAVLADARTLQAHEDTDEVNDFLHKAGLSSVPVFLMSDEVADTHDLRTAGYGAVLPRGMPSETMFVALHSSNAEDPAADQGVVHVEPWAWRQSAGRPRPRLLIADDNRTNLMILQRILESAGYEVDTAKDGEEALDALIQGRYKVAVIDMHMPGLDGVKVVKQYRMMHSGVKTAVIMLTANATLNAKLESAEAGADAYLTKPATATALVSTIKKLLEDREVHELRRDRAGAPAAADGPVLDNETVAELARLYSAPDDLNRLLDTFDAEGRRLIGELRTAAAKRNHPAFCELVHALKGNGANVGAARLARVCLDVENTGMLDFYREGKRLVAQLEGALAEAAQALRERTANKPGSVRGR